MSSTAKILGISNRGLTTTICAVLFGLFVAGCTGSGTGNSQMASQTYGLALQITAGNNQQVIASSIYPTQLTVQLTNITSALSQGQIPVTFTELTNTGVTFLGPTVTQTASNGVASIQVQAPNTNGASVTIRAQVQGTQIYTDFTLTTKPNGNIHHFDAYTTNTNTVPTNMGPLNPLFTGYTSTSETAGVPFTVTITARDVLDAVVSNEQGPLVIDYNFITAPSWLGISPTFPWTPATSYSGKYTCTFVNGYCQMPGVTLTDATHVTYMTVSADVPGPIGISSYPIPVQVGPATQLMITKGGPNSNGTGIPANGCNAYTSSPTTCPLILTNYSGANVLNTTVSSIGLSTAVMDIAGNFLRNGLASDGVTFVGNDPTVFNVATPYYSTHPMSTTGVLTQSTIAGGVVVASFSPTITIISGTATTGGSITAGNGGSLTYTTGSIYVDPGPATSLQMVVQNNGAVNAGTPFSIQLLAYDAHQNFCQLSDTYAGFTGSAAVTASSLNVHDGSGANVVNGANVNVVNTTASAISVLPTFNPGSAVGFWSGQSSGLMATIGRASTTVYPNPTISMTVNTATVANSNGASMVVTNNTNATNTVTVSYGAPARVEMRTGVGSTTTASSNRSDALLCDYTSTVANCGTNLTIATGSSAITYYSYITDAGGNPLKYNGSAWVLTDNNGDPLATPINTWTATTEPANWNPNQFSGVNSATSVLNPNHAGLDTLTLQTTLNGLNLNTAYPLNITSTGLDHFAISTSLNSSGSPAYTNAIAATSQFYVCFQAQDSRNNNLNTVGSYPITISSLSPTASGSAPIITGHTATPSTPTFEGTYSVTLAYGFGCTTALQLPNAKINGTTQFRVTSSAPTATTSTLNITPGSAAQLLIGEATGDLSKYTGTGGWDGSASNFTGTAVAFADNSIPVFYASIYDNLNNFIGQNNVNWTTSVAWTMNSTPYTMGLSTTAGTSTTPVLYTGCANVINSGTLSATYTGTPALTTNVVSTGNFTINSGPLAQITLTQVSPGSPSQMTAGHSANWNITLLDGYQNVVKSFSTVKHFTVSTSGNNGTESGWYQNTVQFGSVAPTFNQGVATIPLTLYSTSSSPTISLHDTDDGGIYYYTTPAVTVGSDTPNFFDIWKNGDFSAGGSNWWNVRLMDAWGNQVSDQPTYASASVSVQLSNAGSLYTNEHIMQTNTAGNLPGSCNATVTAGSCAAATVSLSNAIASMLVTETQAPQNFGFQVTSTAIAGTTLARNCLNSNVTFNSSGFTGGSGICNGGDWFRGNMYVNTGNATQLLWTPAPASNYQASATAPMTTFKVTAEDSWNNIVSDSSSTATLTIATQSGEGIALSGERPGVWTAQFQSGVATFNDVIYPRAHTLPVNLYSSALGLQTTTVPITITHGPAINSLVVLPGQTFTGGVTTLALAVTGAVSSQATVGVPYSVSGGTAGLYVVDNAYNPISATYSSCIFSVQGTVGTDTSAHAASFATTSGYYGPYATFSMTNYLAQTSIMSAACPSASGSINSANYVVNNNTQKWFVVTVNDTANGTSQTDSWGTSASTPISANTMNVNAGDAGITVTVQETDQYFNKLTGDSPTINLAFSDSSASYPASSCQISLVTGSCSISGISFVTLNTGASIQISSVTSAPTGYTIGNTKYLPFNVSGGAANAIYLTFDGAVNYTGGVCTITTNPGAQKAGVPFTITAVVVDQYCNKTAITGAVTFNTTDPQVSGTYTATFNNTSTATASVTNLTAANTTVSSGYSGASSTFILNVATCPLSPSSKCKNSPSYVVNPNSLYQLLVAAGTNQTYQYIGTTSGFGLVNTPTTATAGQSYSYSLWAVDQWNNPVTGALSTTLVATNDPYSSYTNAAGCSILSTASTCSGSLTQLRAGTNGLKASASGTLFSPVTSVTVNPGSAYRIVGLLPGETIINSGNAGATTRAQAIVPGTSTINSGVQAGTSFTLKLQLTDQYYNSLTSGSQAVSGAAFNITDSTGSISGFPVANLSSGAYTDTNGVSPKTATLSGSPQSITISNSTVTSTSDITNTFPVTANSTVDHIKLYPAQGTPGVSPSGILAPIGGQGTLSSGTFTATSAALPLTLPNNSLQACAYGFDIYDNPINNVAVSWNATTFNGSGDSLFNFTYPNGNSLSTSSICNNTFAVRSGTEVLSASLPTAAATFAGSANTVLLTRTIASDGGTPAAITTSTTGSESLALITSGTIYAQYYWNVSADSVNGWVSSSLSWYNETLGTANRGKRKQFPSLAHLVATGSELSIIDATSNNMFMKFVLGGNNALDTNTNGTSSITSLAAKNGKIYVGTKRGVIVVIDFNNDKIAYLDSSGILVSSSNISARNSGSFWSGSPSGNILYTNISKVNSLDVATIGGHDVLAVGSTTSDGSNGGEVDVIDMGTPGASSGSYFAGISTDNSGADASLTTGVTAVKFDASGNIYYAGTGFGLLKTHFASYPTNSTFTAGTTYSLSGAAINSLDIANISGSNYSLIATPTAGLLMINEGSSPTPSAITGGGLTAGSNVVSVQKYSFGGSTYAAAADSSGNVYKVSALNSSPASTSVLTQSTTGKNLVIFNIVSATTFDLSVGTNGSGMFWLRN
jgi:hypothetical protein